MTLSRSQSGLTTFMCLNSRTLAGVREQVSICVLFSVKSQDGLFVDGLYIDVHERFLV